MRVPRAGPVRTSTAAAVAASSTALRSDDVRPLNDYAHEDPSDPSHDLLMLVGSQLAWEIRQRLFESMGYTTSACVAPNCMLAKLGSSLNKPNQSL